LIFRTAGVAIQTIDGTFTTHILSSTTIYTSSVASQQLMLSCFASFAFCGSCLIFRTTGVAIQTIDSTDSIHVPTHFTIQTGFITGFILMLSFATFFASF